MKYFFAFIADFQNFDPYCSKPYQTSVLKQLLSFSLTNKNMFFFGSLQHERNCLNLMKMIKILLIVFCQYLMVQPYLCILTQINNFELQQLKSSVEMEQKTSKSIRLGWTQEEQQFIKHLYEEKKIINWNQISERINSTFRVTNRTSKQCRERYSNYIKFGTNQPKVSGWTKKEDDILYQKYSEIGGKWVQIAGLLPGKSQNCVKNRFYGSLRRLIRKINNVKREQKIKTAYPIKYQSVLKMLQIVKLRDTGAVCIKQKQFLQLRNQILEKAKLRISEQDEQTILTLIDKMHSLSVLTRFISLNKGKKKNTINECRLKYLICNSKSASTKIECDQGQEEQKNYSSQVLERSASQSLVIVDETFIENRDKICSSLVCQACEILNERYSRQFIDQFL